MIVKLDIDCINEHRLIFIDYGSPMNCIECEFNTNGSLSLCNIVENRYSTKDIFTSLCSIIMSVTTLSSHSYNYSLKAFTLYHLIKYGKVQYS